MAQASCLPETDRTSRAKPGERRLALIMIGVLALPVACAIWTHPWFVTQDGSIYIYNSHVILESLKTNNPFRNYYAVRWAPLPYWGAYALLCGLLSILPDPIADHVMLTVASLGLLASILWLRRRVAGWDGMPLVVPLAIVLSINLLWLLGLYNFLLGACCYLLALGVWWSGRDHPGPKRAMLLAGLLAAGYLCHPVTSGLAGLALIILAVASPARRWRRSIAWTLTSIFPTVLLVYLNRNLASGSTISHVRWSGLTDPWSVRAWLVYIRGADITPLAHTGPDIFFSHALSSWSHLPAVTTWSLLGFMLLSLAAFMSVGVVQTPVSGTAAVRRELFARGKKLLAAPMRGWFVVSAILMVCALFGPADLGEGQGAFLRQRFLLLGLATALPLLKTRAIRAGHGNAIARLGFAALFLGCVIQLVILWGYARASSRLASDFMMAKPYTGIGQRVAVLTIEPDIDYEPRPLLHLGDLFGVQTGNIIWNNYAAALPYFPVRFRDPSNCDVFLVPGIPDFETAQITKDDLDDWEDLASDIEGKTDVLVVWGRSRELDEINSQWFGEEPVFEDGQIRVFRHIDRGAGTE